MHERRNSHRALPAAAGRCGQREVIIEETGKVLVRLLNRRRELSNLPWPVVASVIERPYDFLGRVRRETEQNVLALAVREQGRVAGGGLRCVSVDRGARFHGHKHILARVGRNMLVFTLEQADHFHLVFRVWAQAARLDRHVGAHRTRTH